MNREEAINILDDFDVNFEGHTAEEVSEAFDMAFKALEKENIYDDGEHYVTISKALYDKLNIDYEQALSQEPCDDAISRETLLTNLYQYKISCAGRIQAAILEIEELVEKMPSVTQKSGKWIKVKSGDKDFPESIVCSRCNNENSHLDFNENAEPIGKVFVTSKYCPNCGARMVEPQESGGEG